MDRSKKQLKELQTTFADKELRFKTILNYAINGISKIKKDYEANIVNERTGGDFILDNNSIEQKMSSLEKKAKKIHSLVTELDSLEKRFQSFLTTALKDLDNTSSNKAN